MPPRGVKSKYADVPDGDPDFAIEETASFLVKPEVERDAEQNTNSKRSWASSVHLIWVHAVLGICWIVAFASLLSFKNKSGKIFSPDQTSPVFPVLSYSKTRFSTGFKPDLSPYQGEPNEQINARWDNLTHWGIITMTEEEHAKIPEASSLFSDDSRSASDPPVYMGAIEVFHQIHCLDMLRMEIYGILDDWYRVHSPHNPQTKPAHLEHCIDYIRQSMMCRPSLDILPFKTDGNGTLRPYFNGTRSCANFDMVRDWAIERKAGNLSPQ